VLSIYWLEPKSVKWSLTGNNDEKKYIIVYLWVFIVRNSGVNLFLAEIKWYVIALLHVKEVL